METKISKEQQHKLNQERFKKSLQERLECKRLKAEWKRTNPKK